VNALGESTGNLLCNRPRGSGPLTDSGASDVAQAILVLEALEDANRSVREAGGAPRGLLRISMPVVFGSMHIAPAMGLFMRRCPEIELDFQLSDGFVNLVEDRIDIAIRIGKLDSSSLIARRLAPHRRLICASPDYLGEHGIPKHPDRLKGHDWLRFACADGDRTWRMERDGKSLNLKVKGSMTANNSEMLRQTAINGGGLLMMPTWLVGEDLKAGRLTQVLSDWTIGHGETDMAIHAVYLPNRRGAKKVTAFVEHLRSHFGAPPYWEAGVE